MVVRAFAGRSLARGALKQLFRVLGHESVSPARSGDRNPAKVGSHIKISCCQDVPKRVVGNPCPNAAVRSGPLEPLKGSGSSEICNIEGASAHIGTGASKV